ncbi:MAG: HAMP domain-containing protein, partial [Myxococcota bacterium]
MRTSGATAVTAEMFTPLRQEWCIGPDVRRIGIATKIFVGFSGLLVGVVLLAMLSVREIRSAADDLRVLRDGHLALARIAAQLETHQQNRLRDLRRALEEQDPASRELILRVAVTYYPSVIRAGLDSLGRACRRLEQVEEAASPRARHAREFCEGLGDRTSAVVAASAALETLARDMAATDGTSSLEPLATSVADGGEDLRTAMFELDRYLQGATDAAVTRAEGHERSALFRVLASTLGALLLGLAVTIMAARALAPIRPLVRYARAVARGDYHQPLDVGPRGELADLADELRRMARARDDREDKLDRQAKELEKAYLRVEELKRYHESIVRSLRTGVVVTDRVGVITSTNRAARTHWNLDALIGQPLSHQPLGVALERQLGAFENLLAASVPKTAAAIELGTRLADVTAAPLESERGEILGLVVALEDVTEAVRTKEALLRSERLAAIGRMSAHVTHELRNPLASISLNAELLEELSSGAATRATGRSADETRQLCRAIGR